MNSSYDEWPTLAAILTVSKKGYHLFLMPKSVPYNTIPAKPLISPQTLSLFSGVVFVLNKLGKLVQQNEQAKKIWVKFGRAKHILKDSCSIFPISLGDFQNF